MIMAEEFDLTSVLLVGSVPWKSSKEVFTKVSEALPGRLHTIPDGETGDRFNYIGWQIPMLPTETVRDFLGGSPWPESGIPKYTLDDIKPTRYDEVAIESYKEFVELRKRGIIGSDVRFQIGLPTHYSVIHGHCKPEIHEELEPLYGKRIMDSIDRIVKEIPHNDLVIQWDLCFEVLGLEVDNGRPDHPMVSVKPPFTPIREGLIDRVRQCCKHIPSDVSIAFHLCYGDLGHQHFYEPDDLKIVVDFANDLIKTFQPSHKIEWVHMPVPKSRTDAAYFEPLNRLQLDNTRLYLGLIHSHDETGTKERLNTARSVYRHPFGVATECGLGRTPVDEIDSILTIAKNITVPH